MTTISIPKNLASQTKLIAVPESVYEEFLAWQKKVKSKKVYYPTAAEKEMIYQARQRNAKGKFVTLQELRDDLERRR